MKTFMPNIVRGKMVYFILRTGAALTQSHIKKRCGSATWIATMGKGSGHIATKKWTQFVNIMRL
jgi:hypothetical protein